MIVKRLFLDRYEFCSGAYLGGPCTLPPLDVQKYCTDI